MRQLVARLDTLVGEFVSLHTLMLQDTSGPGTCQDALGALFSDRCCPERKKSSKPFSDIAPGMQIGFEPTGSVLLTVQPKQDFSRSPDRCLNAVTIDSLSAFYRAHQRPETLPVRCVRIGQARRRGLCLEFEVQRSANGDRGKRRLTKCERFSEKGFVALPQAALHGIDNPTTLSKRVG